MRPTNNNTDEQLLTQLKGGSHQAYAEIYDRYQPLMFVYACKIMKNESEAADVIQDVFINLWDKKDQLQLHSALASYLYSAVRYKFFNLLDHKKVRTHYINSFREFIDQGVCYTDNYIREKELSKLIEQEISLLPEKMREVFILSRSHNMSNQEIAEALGITEKTVRNQVNNALSQMRKRLGNFRFILFLLFY